MSVTVLEVRHVKVTRKAWQCDGCCRHFEIGTPKIRQRNIGEDGPYTWNSCPTCYAILDVLTDASYNFPDGVQADDMHEYMTDRFGTWEAADAHYKAARETTGATKDEQ